MHFLLFILIGLLAGAVAARFAGGHGYGIVGNTAVGILGAFVGGWFFATFGGVGGSGFFVSLFTAVIGAIALLWVVRLAVPARA
jgi:uncharacterized membrane protein YeaQ/YmgE (transglycosylase-associated protein family)